MEQRYIDRLHAGIAKGKPDECWEWQRARTKSGYGQLAIHRKPQYTHRLIVGAGPGDEVLHTCDNPPCCNPAHLEIATHTENMADSSRKRRARNDKTNHQQDRLIYERYISGEHPRELATAFGYSDVPGIHRVIRRVRRRLQEEAEGR